MSKSTFKKFFIGLCLFGMLAFAVTPAKAEFLGTLHRSESWSLEFLGIGPADIAAVTVAFIDSRGRQDVDVFTIPVGSTSTTLVYNKANLGNNTRRIVITVDLPIFANVGTEMSIWQGDERPGQPPWEIPIASQGTPTRFVLNVAAPQ